MSSSLPVLFPLAFNWEELAPVIFFVIYGIIQFLGSKKKGGEEEPEDSEAQRQAEERARKIREEIQRRIQGRKQPQEQSAQREAAEAPQRSAPTPPPMRRQPAEQRTEPDFSGMGSNPMDDIQRQLAEQAKRIESTKKQREEALAQAKQIEQTAFSKYENKASNRGAYRQNVAIKDSDFIQRLRSGQGAREAILAIEILGPPKSMQ